MFEFKYTLSSDNYTDLNYYIAIHDENVQKKSLTLAISFAFLFAIIIFLIFRMQIITIVLVVIALIACLYFFPKIYWKIVFNRVEKKVEIFKNKMKFSPIKVIFDDEITIDSNNEKTNITYNQVKQMDFTKMNCIMFYEADDKVNNLIIPNDAIGNKMKDFCEYLEKRNLYGGQK